MGIEHKTLPISAVQFHPESIASLRGEAGLKLIECPVNSSNVFNFHSMDCTPL